MEEQHSMMMRTIEIVERSSTMVGSEVRWTVERTFSGAWRATSSANQISWPVEYNQKPVAVCCSD